MHLPRALVCVLLCAASTAGAQVLTTFGNSVTSVGSWTYTPATSTLSGTEGPGDVIFGSPLTLDITGSTSIRLAANAAVAPAGFFYITLVDGVGNEAAAQFKWSDFVGGASVTAPLDYATFQFDDLSGWSLDSGSSFQPLDVSLSEIVAVPEPGAIALLPPALAGLAVARRRWRRIIRRGAVRGVAL